VEEQSRENHDIGIPACFKRKLHDFPKKRTSCFSKSVAFKFLKSAMPRSDEIFPNKKDCFTFGRKITEAIQREYAHALYCTVRSPQGS
jgi:hypothetical protein